jgi:hypothetical protein
MPCTIGVSSNNGILRASSEELITELAAAKRLGIQPSLLQALIESCVCETNRTPIGSRGLHMRDIDAFKSKLLALAPRKESLHLSVKTCVSLGTALSWVWDTPRTKLALVRALLEKHLEIVGTIDGTIAGLQLDRTAYHRLVGQLRGSTSEGTLSASDSAKRIGCGRAAIPIMVQTGVLHGSDGPMGLRVETSSLDDFQKTYIFLAPVAKTLHTLPRGLIRQCARVGIPVVWPRSGSDLSFEPFIHSTDIALLSKTFNERRDRKHAKL